MKENKAKIVSHPCQMEKEAIVKERKVAVIIDACKDYLARVNL